MSQLQLWPACKSIPQQSAPSFGKLEQTKTIGSNRLIRPPQLPIINYTLFSRGQFRFAMYKVASSAAAGSADRDANQRQHCNYRPIAEPRLDHHKFGLSGGSSSSSIGNWSQQQQRQQQKARSTCCCCFWLLLGCNWIPFDGFLLLPLRLPVSFCSGNKMLIDLQNSPTAGSIWNRKLRTEQAKRKEEKKRRPPVE